MGRLRLFLEENMVGHLPWFQRGITSDNYLDFRVKIGWDFTLALEGKMIGYLP